MPKPWEKYQGKPWEKYQASEPESIWTDFKRGAVELAENYVTAVSGFAERLNNPGEAILHPELVAAGHLDSIHPYSGQIAAPETITGTLVSMVPSMLAAMPSWEAGAGEAAGVLGAHTPKVLEWAAKGLGGTLGSDLTSGELPSPESLAAGTGANIAMEGVFHIPQGLRLTKLLLARNGEAIQDAAAHIGVNPSMGVTTSRAWLRTLENVLSKVPGGGHILNMQNAKSLATMDSFIQGIKSKLGYKGDSSALGAEIRQAIAEAEKTFKEESSQAYDAIYAKVPPHTKLNTNALADLMGEFRARYSGDLGEMLTSPIVKQLDALMKAGKSQTLAGRPKMALSITEARALLQRIRDAMESPDAPFKGMNDSDLARMADALSSDIEVAFLARGQGNAWREAQDGYASGRALLNQARATLGRAETGDAIYTRLFGAEHNAFSPKGVDTLAPLKAVMSPGEWEHVAAEIVHRLGLEGAGSAAAEGRQFNPATFLTNWNKLSPQVKDLMFNASHRYDLDALAKLSEGFKNLGRDANHSNTAHHMMVGGMLTHIFTEPVSGLATAAGVTGGSSLLAKLLINPKATRALVDLSYATTPQKAQQAIIKLVAIAAAHPELSDAIAELGGDKN